MVLICILWIRFYRYGSIYFFMYFKEYLVLKSINIIGAGKLGKTIGKLIHSHGLGEIKGIVNSNLDNATHAAEFIGAGTAYNSIEDIPKADIIFITTPDTIIEEMSDKIVSLGKCKKDTIIIQFSGILPSHVLSHARDIGCHTASIHPIKSFADPELAHSTFHGTYCAFEGDIEALKVILPMFKDLEAILIEINPEKKSLYHAACAVASNYLVTLSHIASSCFVESGISADDSLDITDSLMAGTLDNIRALRSHQQALTGPISRGDEITILKHYQAMRESSSKVAYKALGEVTLDLTRHNDEVKRKILLALK